MRGAGLGWAGLGRVSWEKGCVVSKAGGAGQGRVISALRIRVVVTASFSGAGALSDSNSRI